MARNRHHVVPRSRGGRNRANIVRLPVNFHLALHAVFGNLRPEEYQAFLDEVLVPGTEWTDAALEEARRRSRR